MTTSSKTRCPRLSSHLEASAAWLRCGRRPGTPLDRARLPSQDEAKGGVGLAQACDEVLHVSQVRRGDASSGARRRRSAEPGASPPLAPSISFTSLYVISATGQLHALSLATGRKQPAIRGRSCRAPTSSTSGAVCAAENRSTCRSLPTATPAPRTDSRREACWRSPSTHQRQSRPGTPCPGRTTWAGCGVGAASRSIPTTGWCTPESVTRTSGPTNAPASSTTRAPATRSSP